MDLRVTWAQNREDVILSGFFPDVTAGHYVDVGAGHPTTLSVTHWFYERGWSGINVEPIAELAELLRTERPRDVTVQAAVGAEPGTATFRQYSGSGLSSLNPTVIAAHADAPTDATAEFTDYDVPVTTLAELLRDHRFPHLHFLKVDVEGSEYDVLAGNDWDAFRPEVLCIETDHVVRDWTPLLAAARYERVFDDGLNAYFVAEEARHRADAFRFSAVVLEGGPLVGPAVADEVRAAAELRDEKWALQQELATAEQERLRLESSLEAEISLRVAHVQREAFLVSRLAEQEAYLADVLSSTSWRITKPIRRLTDLLRARLPRPVAGRLRELRDQRQLQAEDAVEREALSPDGHVVLDDLNALADDQPDDAS